MASNVIFNGVTYSIPADGDNNWGPDVTAYFIAIAGAALQKTGGSFTLTAEAAFGATYGLKSAYIKSYATNPAASGAIRLGNTESVSFRNNANSADLALTSNASDALLFNSKNVLFSALGLIVNADVNAAAAIAYSKLNLSASIVNADIAVGAAIAYSKLNLATSIVNADVAAAAAIVLTKLAATTISRALVSDASGFIVPATTTAIEIGYVSGVTSAIQTQLTANRPMTTGGDIVYGGASGLPTRLANGTAGQVLQSNGTTLAPSWSSAPTLTPPTVQVFAASGTYTPTAGMKYCIVEAVGGGAGGGGGAGAASQGSAGGGGGGGAYSRAKITAAQIGASQVVTIGAAGAGGAAGNNTGTGGGATSLGVLVVANGGSGGSGCASSAGYVAAQGGLGGVLGTGDFKGQGMNGGIGYANGLVHGQSGFGAGSILGGGGQSNLSAGAGSVAGAVGTGYGGGGGGGNQSNGTAVAGGAGTIGYMTITEFFN